MLKLQRFFLLFSYLQFLQIADLEVHAVVSTQTPGFLKIYYKVCPSVDPSCWVPGCVDSTSVSSADDALGHTMFFPQRLLALAGYINRNYICLR